MTTRPILFTILWNISSPSGQLIDESFDPQLRKRTTYVLHEFPVNFLIPHGHMSVISPALWEERKTGQETVEAAREPLNEVY